MVRLFRAMREDQHGLPEIGATARSLGVRPGTDVLAILANEIVRPGSGGLSVSPHYASNLPYFRRPQQLGGTGKDPVWMIDDDRLGSDLVYRPDPKNTSHGFIEPNRSMTLSAFQQALAATQPLWQGVP